MLLNSPSRIVMITCIHTTKQKTTTKKTKQEGGGGKRTLNTLSSKIKID